MHPVFRFPIPAQIPHKNQVLTLDTSHVLSASVTPVVLISACGLVTLALYNRLGTILARIRAFHSQKIELLKQREEPGCTEYSMLLEMLDTQIDEVTVKARMIQKGLTCLLAAIAAFLVCSLLAGAAVIDDGVGLAAIVMGALGNILFLIGLGWAMRELMLSISPLEEETGYLKVLSEHYSKAPSFEKRLTIAETA
jgi:Protein of unknown function (DUF2721)